MFKLAVGCDPNAIEYLERLTCHLRTKGYTVEVLETEDPIYANTAFLVGNAVANGIYDRGILICGTGIGMSIAANKVPGIRAALITDVYSAQRAILSNDSNIACFGALTLGYKNFELLADIWLEEKYNRNTPSEAKVRRIDEYDEKWRIAKANTF